MNKLERLGIRGTTLNWFVSYLSNRVQCVYVNSDLSPPLEMKFGVPQGSVLGPLLFLIYVNDMPQCSDKLSFTLFADDTCLFMNHENPKVLECLVNEELKKVNEWLINNQLTLNVSKSCYLFFFRKKE